MATINEARHWTIGDWVKVRDTTGQYPIKGWASSVGPLGGEVKPTSRRRALVSETPRVILWTSRDWEYFKVSACRRVAPPSLLKQREQIDSRRAEQADWEWWQLHPAD